MKFELITDAEVLKKAFDHFVLQIRKQTPITISLSICIPRKTEKTNANMKEDLSFWWAELKEQYFVFGLNYCRDAKFISSPCHFTIPKSFNHRSGGAFAKGEDGRVYLVNRGNFFFVDYYTGKRLKKEDIVNIHYSGVSGVLTDWRNSQESQRVIVVCCIEGENFFKQLLEFTFEVYRIKASVETPSPQAKQYTFSNEELEEIRKTSKKLATLGDSLFWSYANMGAVFAALKANCLKLHRIHYVIRERLFNKLKTGEVTISTFFKDEKDKLILPRACYYCGSAMMLSADHVFSRKRGGDDCGDNLILACRKCNSSKSSRDLLEWMYSKNEFPPLLLLRRYLKLSIRHSVNKGLLGWPLDKVDEISAGLPFAPQLIPYRFPRFERLRLWVSELEDIESALGVETDGESEE